MARVDLCKDWNTFERVQLASIFVTGHTFPWSKVTCCLLALVGASKRWIGLRVGRGIYCA